MSTPSEQQQAVIQRFVTACESDERIAAAFLGGSFASGKADEYSDLDIYLITTDEAYDDFFTQRQAFMRSLGAPVFLEDFNEFGFDMVLFTFTDGVEGELALARESSFIVIHGGPHEVLVDKKGLLAGKVFPLMAPTAEEQQQTVRRSIYWFWEDLSHFITLIYRGQLWAAFTSLDQMRRKVVNMAHLEHDFTVEAGGYLNAKDVVPEEELLLLQSTFGPLEPKAMLEAVLTLIQVYKRTATRLAAKHDIAYPTGLEGVLSNRLDRLRDHVQSA
jgi:predicted nucleotidyltransferase